MKFKFHQHNKKQIAELTSEDLLISSVQDALDLMANAGYPGGARKVIIKEEQLSPDFFDLKTGLAGEILQKFSTYDVSLAIIGNFDKYQSKSLRDFIRESNRTRRILFIDSIDKVKEIW
jgi:hypothetical protein